MYDPETRDRVVAVHDLRDYFRESVDTTIKKQGVEVDSHAAHYVVNLLTLFSRSDKFYEDHGEEYGLRPLALMMADAAEARSPTERNFFLQRIGDVALFISGFFADSLANKVVDLDYYIHMGGNAYGSLSDEMRGTVRGKVYVGIYRELAQKFNILVDVLNEVRDDTSQESSTNLLRTYEIWLKTGSQRAARLLQENGVVPITSVSARNTH
jgi:hypothetical protein